MLLQGSLQEFSLPNVLQLVKMSAKTGVLTLSRMGERGQVFFRDGHVYFATVEPCVVPLGQRLLRAGRLTAKQLDEALAEQRASDGDRIGSILVVKGFIDRGILAEAIADQIEEAAFSLLSWTEGDFEFRGGEAADEDIIVELSVDGVIMDGARRLDEWDVIISSLGSLQHIPTLTYGEDIASRGSVSLSADDWRLVSSVDGHRDIASVIRECGLNRFAAAKALYRLAEAGLLEMKPAAIQGLGSGEAVLVSGPIDFYTEVFLDSLNDEPLMRHVISEIVGRDEVDVPITVVTLPPEEEEGGETLVLSVAAGTPELAWRQLATRCTTCLLLVNANSAESARASRGDLSAARAVEKLPLMVVSYVSVSEEGIPGSDLVQVLGLPPEVPVLGCDLHDRRGVAAVVRAALAYARSPQALPVS